MPTTTNYSFELALSFVCSDIYYRAVPCCRDQCNKWHWCGLHMLQKSSDWLHKTVREEKWTTCHVTSSCETAGTTKTHRFSDVSPFFAVRMPEMPTAVVMQQRTCLHHLATRSPQVSERHAMSGWLWMVRCSGMLLQSVVELCGSAAIIIVISNHFYCSHYN